MRYNYCIMRPPKLVRFWLADLKRYRMLRLLRKRQKNMREDFKDRAEGVIQDTYEEDIERIL